MGKTRLGAYAEYMSIPAASLIAIPQQMPARVAALTEPAATAWHAINLSMRSLHRPLHGCRVLVIGGDATGTLAALLLKQLGVQRLAVTELNPLRPAVGYEVIDPRAQPLAEAHYGHGMDAVGSKLTRQQAFAAIKPGGVIMQVSLQNWASEIDMRKLTLAEITLLGICTYTTADLRATVDALHWAQFGDLDWVEDHALADRPQAFVDFDGGHSGSAKIVLRP